MAAVRHTPYPGETWLSDRERDPNELTNLARDEPEQLARMQAALARTLNRRGAPPEQHIRLELAVSAPMIIC